ncbi:MAG: TRAP transporter small permease [Alphaproteobacteria bacterium]|nr:TRAP transporter small permease [Alphaproteobacteria bacterium]
MPDQHNRAVAGLYGLNLWLIRLAGWLILGITVVTVFGVFMRYALRAPEVWSYPLSAYLLCLVVFLSVAHTHQEGVHVRVDYFLELLPRRMALALRLVGDVLSACFLVVMTWLLWKLFAETVQRGRIDETTLGWPLAAIQWCLPAGIALLLLTHVVVSWSEFARARRPPAQGHGEQTF